jgi:hypothetical protein
VSFCSQADWVELMILVGVVGSGRGVTQYEKMGKHKFETAKEE